MIRELAVTELANELAERNISLDDAPIWDVRDNASYLAGHIEGAVNYFLDDGIEKGVLDTAEGTVYVLCGGGGKAPKAGKHLDELDGSRDIVILTGGTRGAKSAGMIIVGE